MWTLLYLWFIFPARSTFRKGEEKKKKKPVEDGKVALLLLLFLLFFLFFFLSFLGSRRGSLSFKVSEYASARVG